MDPLIAHLIDLTDPQRPDGYLAGGVARIAPDGGVTAFLTGRRGPEPDAPRVSDPSLRLRMASISKAATARLVVDLAVGGALDLDADIRDVLDWTDAPPALIAQPVTVAMLLDHTSGLTDHGGYIFAPPTDPREFVADIAHTAIGGTAPGTFFRYANLNYVLLGAIVERATGERFDRLMRRHVLEPAGIAGGFNWAGVEPWLRRHRLPLFQRRGATFEPTADQPDADWSADVIWSGGVGYSLDAYVAGRDSLLFSPHAGLRMNVVEAAQLARFLARDDAAGRRQRDVTWTYDAHRLNGADCDGLYTRFGAGLMIYLDHPKVPGDLIGHAGHALGFTGGAWHNRATGATLAYFLTGSADLTDGLDDEVFYAEDELVFMVSA